MKIRDMRELMSWVDRLSIPGFVPFEPRDRHISVCTVRPENTKKYLCAIETVGQNLGETKGVLKSSLVP